MNERLYSLFQQQPDGSWKRYTTLEYPKAQAVRIFQDHLLSAALGTSTQRFELRAVASRPKGPSKKQIRAWKKELGLEDWEGDY